MRKIFLIRDWWTHDKYLPGLQTHEVLPRIPSSQKLIHHQFCKYISLKRSTRPRTIQLEKIRSWMYMILDSYNKLPFTWDPSSGQSKPSPPCIIFLTTFLSRVISTTLFQDMSWSWIVNFDAGGITLSMLVLPFTSSLKPSVNVGVTWFHNLSWVKEGNESSYCSETYTITSQQVLLPLLFSLSSLLWLWQGIYYLHVIRGKNGYPKIGMLLSM